MKIIIKDNSVLIENENGERVFIDSFFSMNLAKILASRLSYALTIPAFNVIVEP